MQLILLRVLLFIHRCVCKNHHERDTCLGRGWIWNKDTCRCMCPDQPYPTCPNNYMFDYLTTCSCIPLHNEASVEIITMIILTSLGTMIGVGIIFSYLPKLLVFDRFSQLFSITTKDDKELINMDKTSSITTEMETKNLISDN